MIGLAIEAREKPDWPKHLSSDEANLAARYMTMEMNGFPPWASRLLAAYPDECDKVISQELQWEFSSPAEDSPPYHVLHDLEHYAEELRAHYRPFVVKLPEQNDPAHSQTLESALTILLQWHDLCQESFIELARKRCVSATEEGRYLTWLVAWMCVDAEGAFFKLRQWIDGAGNSAEADRRMILFSWALMYYRSIRFGSAYRDFERIEILHSLIPLVYTGQMELYLRWLDKHERAAGEEAPIGLILCAGSDSEQVELLQLDEKSIRIAEYLTELPPIELLRSRLHLAIELAREQTARSGDDKEITGT